MIINSENKRCFNHTTEIFEIIFYCDLSNFALPLVKCIQFKLLIMISSLFFARDFLEKLDFFKKYFVLISEFFGLHFFCVNSLHPHKCYVPQATVLSSLAEAYI